MPWRRRSLPVRLFRGFIITILSLILVPAVVGATTVAAFLYLPLPAKLPVAKNTLPSQPSKVYDVNGAEIAIFRQHDINIPVQEKDIPPVLKQALISAEDQKFYSHHGVDLQGSFRALIADLRNKKVKQGGSTITQQYVKKAYTGNERTIDRKVREAILASQLDRQVNKDEILFRYLSIVYLGDGAYGAGAAADTYFRKPVSQLTASEAATLAGVIPAPSLYAPRENLSGAENKRRIVLKKMFEQGYLTQPKYDEAVAQPLWLESQGPPPGPVTLIYAPRGESAAKYPYFVDYVRRYLVAKYGEDRVFRGGLTIQTTIDPRLQDLADQTVAGQLSGTKSPLEMSLVTVEPPTGYVRAMVGGRDFNSSQVNLALGGCPAKLANQQYEVEPQCWSGKTVVGGGTGRQPGSSWKPFVLSAAYQKGIQPSKTYNAPATYKAPGCGKALGNSEGHGGGRINLKEATAKSVNTVFAQLVRDAGFPETAQVAKDLGITSSFFSSTYIGKCGQFALGVIEVSPLDMAAAYSVFANRGLRQPATPIVKVIDDKGKIVEDNTGRQAMRVLDESVADNVTAALQGVITNGTATRAQIDRQAAGKTGTTNDYKDAWFIGYTPTLSTAVWMGYSDAPRSLLNIKGVGRVFGGTIPAQTWARFMKPALADIPKTKFSDPAPIKAPADIQKLIKRDVQRQQFIESGAGRSPIGTSTGKFEDPVPNAKVDAPSTTTVPPSTPQTTILNTGPGGPTIIGTIPR